MASFIKLTFGIINVAYINKILIKNNRYYIHITDNLSLSKTVFKICETKNKQDYTIIKYWINSM